MNKVFSSNQRKDKNMSTGQYIHPTQEPVPVSDTRKSGWPLIAGCLILAAIVVLVVLL